MLNQTLSKQQLSGMPGKQRPRCFLWPLPVRVEHRSFLQGQKQAPTEAGSNRSRLRQNFFSSTWVWGLWANPLLSGVRSRTGLLLAPRKHSDTETHSRMSGRGHLWSTHFSYAQRSARRHCRVSPEQGPYPACAPHSRPRTGSAVLVSSRLSLWDSLGCVALDKGKQSPIQDV